MVPMRLIPFQVVCVLGLEESAFPARDARDPLNRIGTAIRAVVCGEPAGGALAVDRGEFSASVTRALVDHPLVTIDRAEVAGLPLQEEIEQQIHSRIHGGVYS